MALNLAAFVQDLRAQVIAAWPEVAPTGVLEAEHAEMIAWTDLTLPYSVILVSNFRRADFGLANAAFYCSVDIYYVLSALSAASGLRGKMENIVSQLYPLGGTLTTGQVEDVELIDYSDTLAVNEIFRAANRAQRAGLARFRCLIADTV